MGSLHRRFAALSAWPAGFSLPRRGAAVDLVWPKNNFPGVSQVPLPPNLIISSFCGSIGDLGHDQRSVSRAKLSQHSLKAAPVANRNFEEWIA